MGRNVALHQYPSLKCFLILVFLLPNVEFHFDTDKIDLPGLIKWHEADISISNLLSPGWMRNVCHHNKRRVAAVRAWKQELDTSTLGVFNCSCDNNRKDNYYNHSKSYQCRNNSETWKYGEKFTNSFILDSTEIVSINSAVSLADESRQVFFS